MSISAELFGQLVDANFTPPCPEPEDLHNFTDLSLLAIDSTTDRVAKKLVSVAGSGDALPAALFGRPQPNHVNCPNDDVNLEPVDMDLESQSGNGGPKKIVRFLNATPEVSTRDQENIDHSNYKSMLQIESPLAASLRNEGPVPTPVAMRNISMEARRELALLYQDESPSDDQPLDVSY